ncbi:MAG: His/Gly/Thr/Pro-type tRNA ligase C-terminal domain-containing protein, partial [Eubacteriales bacterium]|nr:His/Gly/Thr/Pro-type tRNA ligase C-terminal domain-containing protein [Eubacteriales bacterium]
GWKFNEWELKGVPLRLEIGPRDIENGVATALRRDTLEKFTLDLGAIDAACVDKLAEIQTQMYEKAYAFRMAHEFSAGDMAQLADRLDNGKGYIRAMWCGQRECEDSIKEQTGATSRCMPFEQQHIADTCVCCGKPAKKLVLWARAY